MNKFSTSVDLGMFAVKTGGENEYKKYNLPSEFFFFHLKILFSSNYKSKIPYPCTVQ